MSRFRASSWFERNPGVAIAVGFALPLAIGVGMVGLFTGSMKLVRWITWPFAIVAALVLFVWWIAAWLVPRVQSNPRWAAAARRVSLLGMVGLWFLLTAMFWWFDDPEDTPPIFLLQLWWMSSIGAAGGAIRKPLTAEPPAPTPR